ncbi:ParA family protein [Alterisphingorhabdus coralli]|uniref:ParA family protein n=1 Tax=Alterisphingorhabdus coralli TaxID=3071408 RepID=A0AA97F9Q0_9SPHN|nr:ParA family protein [Parasphingorhabdus sp. SCSIO 66989]WOE76736.1 ParA family protein [Parasphingorhabdus sp. SCSIO 66989]
MSIIMFTNTKGGTGKTTSAFLVAEGLVENNSVAFLDCDRNRHLSKWQERRGGEGPFMIVEADNQNEDEAFNQLTELEKAYDVVIVDMEGIKSQIIYLMLQLAHLAIIPLRPSAMEIAMTADTTQIIHKCSQAARRSIPYRVLLNRLSGAIVTKAEKALRAELRADSIPVLENGLLARESYAEIFATGKTLAELAEDGKRSHHNALANARAVSTEIAKLIKEL